MAWRLAIFTADKSYLSPKSLLLKCFAPSGLGGLTQFSLADIQTRRSAYDEVWWRAELLKESDGGVTRKRRREEAEEERKAQQLWGGGESSHSFFLTIGHLQVLMMPVQQFWWRHQASPLLPGDPPSSDVFIFEQMFVWHQQTGASEHQSPVCWCLYCCREHFSASACKAGPVQQVWCVALTCQTESTTNDKRDILQP